MISIVLGTRPEIIKLSPVIRELEKEGIPFSIIHTGQHYTHEMDAIFFSELKLPDANVNLEIGSHSNNVQIGKMLVGLDRVFQKERPEMVVVQGDANSTVSGAVAASNLQIPIAYVESGLRSFDMRMQEERNRIIASHCATVHFAPTETSKRNLLADGISEESILITGNTVVDACMQNLKLAKKTNLPDEFALMTAHRPENVDVKDRFSNIIRGINSIGMKVRYPIHPRSEKMMKEFGLDHGRIELTKPMGYLEFLYNLSKSKFVVTDSGGVVEEAASLRIPTICVRDCTDRPEAVEAGICVMADADPERIRSYGERLNTDEDFRNKMMSGENPYGDGRSAERIVRAIKSMF